MAIDERTRQELYRRLEEVLGASSAVALMEYLPPVGWADVATKHDLGALERRMDLRFARVEERFAGLEQQMDLRFARVEERFAGLEQQMDLRFARVEERFAGLEQRIDLRCGHIEQRVEDRITSSSADLRAAFEHGLRSQTTTMVFALVSVVLTMAGFVHFA